MSHLKQKCEQSLVPCAVLGITGMCVVIWSGMVGRLRCAVNQERRHWNMKTLS